MASNQSGFMEAFPRSVEALLYWWSAAVVTEFNVPAEPMESSWVVEFSSSDGITNRIDVLPIVSQGGLLVRLNGATEAHQINYPVIPGMILDPLSYKDKRIWELPRNNISKLAVTRKGQEEQAVERGGDGKFISLSTSGAQQINSLALGKMLDCLTTLKTDKYVTYNRAVWEFTDWRNRWCRCMSVCPVRR